MHGYKIAQKSASKVRGASDGVAYWSWQMSCPSFPVPAEQLGIMHRSENVQGNCPMRAIGQGRAIGFISLSNLATIGGKLRKSVVPKLNF